MRNCCLCHKPLGGEFWEMQLMAKLVEGSTPIHGLEYAYACKRCVELAEKLINKEK